MNLSNARSTPLQIAADCSGRWVYRGDQDLKLKKILPDDGKLLQTNSQDRSSRFLDTIRILVENGGDPMISNVNGDTALHLHTGAIAQFQYLLQQEKSVTECFRENNGSDTIAERHARWYWAQGPAKATIALKYENEQKRQVCKQVSEWPPPFSLTSKTLLLHEMASHLKHFFERDANDFFETLLLIQTLIKEGVDIHNVCDGGFQYHKTPLIQITNISNEIELSQKGLDQEAHVTNRVLDAWLDALAVANVDLQRYIEEEERLIQTSGIGQQWESYEHDDAWEYLVHWDFGFREDDELYPVLVQYIFRQVPEEQPKEFLHIGVERVNVPGGWVEEPD
ncbi:MAG: hypothetical protein Q9225_007198 [Loekoesia sp. 1 TL-2023]